LKQKYRAVHHNYHCLLVATNLVSFSKKTQHHWKNTIFLRNSWRCLVFTVTCNYIRFTRRCSNDIVLWVTTDNYQKPCTSMRTAVTELYSLVCVPRFFNRFRDPGTDL